LRIKGIKILVSSAAVVVFAAAAVAVFSAADVVVFAAADAVKLLELATPFSSL